jgi:hypothetical protein
MSNTTSPAIGVLRVTTLSAILVCLGCRGDIARWTGKPEGTICLRPGMSRQTAQQNSTIRLNTYGDSGRFFDFVLAGDSIRFRGCVQYMLSDGPEGRISLMAFDSANESWPDLLRALRQTERVLLQKGWSYAPGSHKVDSLPVDARDAPITSSGAIDAFHFVKGDLSLTITPSALWSGLPKWRSQKRAKVFWRSTTITTADSDEEVPVR